MENLALKVLFSVIRDFYSRRSILGESRRQSQAWLRNLRERVGASDLEQLCSQPTINLVETKHLIYPLTHLEGYRKMIETEVHIQSIFH